MAGVRVAWWIRTDLRLHDNSALAAALDLRPDALYPIWTWDPHYVYHTRVSPNRWRFLLDCQQDLSDSIREKTGGKNGLLVLRGNPETCLHQVLKSWGITHLVFEKDTDTYGMKRDKRVIAMAESLGVKVVTKLGRTLYDPEKLTDLNHGKAIYNISTVQKLGPQIGKIPRPVDAPEHMPAARNTKLDLARDEKIQTRPDLNVNQRMHGTDDVTCFERIDGPDGSFAVPTMEELNMKPATGPHRGGETRALEALAAYMEDKKKTATFEKPKTNPVKLARVITQGALLEANRILGKLSAPRDYTSVSPLAFWIVVGQKVLLGCDGRGRIVWLWS